MGIALITNNILSDSGTAIAGLVPTSRTISTTAPLTGGGDLSADRTIAIPAATSAVNGYLTSADWTTFNSKQAAGDYITSLTGEATGTGPGATAVTLNNASVTGKVLTGVNITGGTVLATDTMLTAFGKLQNQINGLIGSTIYQGVWNASTNTPTLTSSVGTNGFYYIVNVAGNTNLDGITDWKIGDWAIFNGGVWQKVDNTESVTSVNGFTGAVSLTTDNIAEGTTNLYFSNARARSAVSLTTTGSSGAATYNNTTGVFNIPNYGLALADYLPLAGGTLTGALGGTTALFSGSVRANNPAEGATGEGLIAGQSFKIDGTGSTQKAVMYMVSNILSDTYASGLTAQYANFAGDKAFGFNLNTTGGFELYVKNTNFNKALTISNTGAATFGSSITATSLIKSGGTASQFLMADGSVSTGPAGGITGSLTTNYVTKATGTNTIGNSLIFDNGTSVGIGLTTSLLGRLSISSGNFAGLRIDTNATYSALSISGAGIVAVDAPSIVGGRFMILDNGNTTIGTNVDSGYKLDVNGTGRFSGALRVNTASTIYGATQDAIQTILTLGGQNASSQAKELYFRLTAGGTPAWTFQTAAVGTDTNINIFPNGTAGLTIAYAGAATFSSSVTAVTNLRVNSTGVTGSAYSAVLINSPVVTWNIVNDDNGGGGDLRFYNDSTASDALRIKRTNNFVGIGTTSPSYKLTIDNIAGGNRATLGIDIFENYARIQAYGNGTSSGFLTLNPLGNNVGIGTTSPTTLLDIKSADPNLSINQTTNSNNSGIRFKTNDTEIGKITAQGQNGVMVLNMGVSSGWGGVMTFQTDTAERMRITSGGNVLIGTTTDGGYKLAISTGNQTALRIDTNANYNAINIGGNGNISVDYPGIGGGRFYLDGGGALTIRQSMTATSFFESSDERLKTLKIDDVQVEGIEKLKAKLYIKDDKLEYGYFAQEAESYMPSAITVGKNGYLNLSYREVHTAKIAKLEKEVEELKSQLARL